MSIKEGCDLVEKFLEQKYDKAMGLEKFKTKLQPAKPKVEVRREEPQRPKLPTLSNNIGTPNTRSRAQVRTDEERIQAAIAYAKGLRP
jgi:hypothetical protein